MTNPGPRLEERWLWLNWPLTQSAQLWLVGPDGQAEQFDNGARVPLRERPIASRQLLFPIVLGPGETRTAYLRLSSRTSLFVDLSLWQPAAYADAREIRMALRFFIGGATAIVIVYSVLAWRARRRPALLGAAAAQLCLLAVGMTLDGLPGDWMLGGDGLRPGEVVNSLAFLLLAADAFFAREFLRLTEGHPRLDRGVRGVAWLSLPLAAVPFFWSAFNLISAVWLAGIVFLTVVVAFAAVRGDAVARAYLAGWGLLWLGIIVRELGVFGWLGGLPFVSDLPLLGVYASAFAVSYALHLDLSRARAEADVASRRLLEQRESEAERLQRAVETGTRALRQAADRAQAASRAKSAFLSTVSHELRTPLHTILGYTRMLLGSQKDADARAKLALVERGGRSLLGLVDELLEFSHGDHITAELQLEPLSLPGLLADLEQSSRLLAAERGNRLLVSLGDGLPDVVRADERKLTRALQNLVGNACKFTENGTIGVSVEAEAGAPGGEPWRGLRFSVEDTGIGIAPEDRERVFDPFARASTALGRPGIGLGLAIAQQLVRAMGGEITVESAPGQGSRSPSRCGCRWRAAGAGSGAGQGAADRLAPGAPAANPGG